MQFFDFYQFEWATTVTPLRFSPYSQWVIWSRPDTKAVSWDEFDIDFYGSTDLVIGTVETERTENMRTCEYSFYDWIENDGEIFPESYKDCPFNGEYDSEYEDDYFSWEDLVSRHLGDEFVENWYGEQAIWNYWVLDRYEW